MDAMSAMVQRHYATICKVTLSDAAAQEIADSLHEEIFEMADGLAGSDRPGETFWEKAGRLTTAEATARSEVLRENLPTGEENGGDE